MFGELMFFDLFTWKSWGMMKNSHVSYKIRICFNVVFRWQIKKKTHETRKMISFSESCLFNAENVLWGDLWEPTFPSLLGVLSYNRTLLFQAWKQTRHVFSMRFLGSPGSAVCLWGRCAMVDASSHPHLHDAFQKSTMKKPVPKVGTCLVIVSRETNNELVIIIYYHMLCNIYYLIFSNGLVIFMWLVGSMWRTVYLIYLPINFPNRNQPFMDW